MTSSSAAARLSSYSFAIDLTAVLHRQRVSHLLNDKQEATHEEAALVAKSFMVDTSRFPLYSTLAPSL